MIAEAKLYATQEGVVHVESDGQDFGLGLIKPIQRVLHVPTLASATPLLSMDEIRKIVDSEDFSFGEKLFDSSWTTNQNGFGSCAAYAGKSALEKARHVQGQQRIELSGDYLYSLVNGGGDRGALLKDVMEALQKRGAATAETVPLGKIFRGRYDTQKADAEAERFRGHELFAVPDEQSMATALALRIPVVIAIHVTRRWRDFDSDWYLAPASGVGNHSEHCDDIRYDTRRGRLIFRKATSHSTSYGNGGYSWTSWQDHYKTTSQHHVFYAVGAAIQDPQGDNPPVIDGHADPVPAVKVSLEMASRPGCSWCEKFKSQELPKVVNAGWDFAENRSDGPVPRFVLRVATRQKEFIGFQTADSLMQEAERLR